MNYSYKHNSMNKKELVIIFVVSVIYILLMNMYSGFELGHDQSRHAVNGQLWYYYFHGYGNKQFQNIDQFILSFPQFSIGKIGWYFLLDPPLYGLATALSYTLFGMNEFAARFPSQIFTLAGALLLYLLVQEFTTKKHAAIIAALYGFTPFVFQIGRDAMTDTAAAAFVIGWIYFTFFIGKNNSENAKRPYLTQYLFIIIGGIFLTAATLMKYTSVLFIIGFIPLYLFYLMYKKYKKEKKIFSTELVSFIFAMLLQVAIIFALSWWWISYAIIEQNTFSVMQRIGTENWTHKGPFYNIAFLLYEYIIETAGYFLFTLFLIKKERITEKHIPLIFCACSFLFVVPLFLSNVQPRYFLPILPCIIIATYTSLQRYKEVYVTGIAAVYIIFFIYVNIFMSYTVLLNNGAINTDAFDTTMHGVHGSALFFNYYGNFDTIDIVSGPNILTMQSWWFNVIDGDDLSPVDKRNQAIDKVTSMPTSRTMHHYYNPDQFMFRMFQKLEKYPEIGFVYLSAAELQGEYGEDVLMIMNSTKDRFPTYFVISNTKNEEEYQYIESFIAGVITEKHTYTYWDFFEVK